MCEDKMVQLAEIEDSGEVELGRGNVISTGDLAAYPGNYPVYSSSAVGLGEFGRYGKYMFDEPLITWSVDGGGRPFLRKQHRFSVTNVCGYLRIRDPRKWDYGYLHAAILKAHEKIQFDYQAKAHPSVIRELYHLRWVPIKEQRLIARILDTLETQIQKTEALIAKLVKVKEGLLHDLLTRGIGENGRLRPSPEQAPELYKESPLGLIPREWDAGELGKKAKITVGFVGTTSRFYTTEENGVTFFRTGNITENGLDSSDVKRVIPEFHKANPKSSLRIGDIVVSRVGYTGNAAVVPEVGEANCANMIIIRAHNDFPDFIRLLFSSSFMIEQVAGFTVGSAQPVLNIGMVNRLISIHPGLTEQNKIIRHMDCITQIINIEINYLEEKSSTKAGLMDDLLTGRVRVTPLLEQTKATTPA